MRSGTLIVNLSMLTLPKVILLYNPLAVKGFTTARVLVLHDYRVIPRVTELPVRTGVERPLTLTPVLSPVPGIEPPKHFSRGEGQFMQCLRPIFPRDANEGPQDHLLGLVPVESVQPPLELVHRLFPL